MRSDEFDILVIGEGLSGICAAATARQHGARVMLVSKGSGSFLLGTGCLDLSQLDLANQASLPFRACDIEPAISAFLELTATAGCGYEGGVGERRLVPTSLGTFAEASLAPRQLWKGDPRAFAEAVVVGIDNVSTFDANFVAERLTVHSRSKGLPTLFHAASINLPRIHNQNWLTLLEIATDFDHSAFFRQAMIDALKPIAKSVDLLIIPGVLGLMTSVDDIQQVEEEIGCPICELPTVPPCIPGLRLLRRLETHLTGKGVELLTGFAARDLHLEAGRCMGVEIETPGKPRTIRADYVILAAGRFSRLLLNAAMPPLQVNGRLQPVDTRQEILAENLLACGSVVGDYGVCDRNAIDVITGFQAGLLACQQGVSYAES